MRKKLNENLNDRKKIFGEVGIKTPMTLMVVKS